MREISHMGLNTIFFYKDILYIMKQLIYYIQLTDGERLISITRNDAIEKINNHFKDEKYFKPLSISVLDRLIINGKSNSFIETATKQPINDYYKTEIELFIKNDKKRRTDDAMKKAINRYVNKLYYGNLIVKDKIKTIENNIETNSIDNMEQDIVEGETAFHNIKTTDTIKTIEYDNNEVKTPIETDDIIKTDVETDNKLEDEIEPIYNDDSENENIDNDSILSQLTDYLNNDEENIDVDCIKNYYNNHKEIVNDAFMNSNMGMLITSGESDYELNCDKPKTKRRVKNNNKTLRVEKAGQRFTIKKPKK